MSMVLPGQSYIDLARANLSSHNGRRELQRSQRAQYRRSAVVAGSRALKPM